MSEATSIATALRGREKLLLAVAAGVMLAMLHTNMLALPRADFIDALDSDRYRIQWITGAYLLGSAIGMALTRTLGGLLGMRRAFLLGLAGFTICGGLCAAVSTVIDLAPLRLVQGMGNGLIVSVGMAILWRAFSNNSEPDASARDTVQILADASGSDGRALAMATYGIAIFVPAMVGTSLGGLLTAWQSWRWIFLMLLPLGLGAFLLAWHWLPRDEPDKPHAPAFDFIGLGLLLAWIATMSVVLDMGQYWGWLASPRFLPWFVGFVAAFGGFIAWGLLAAYPLTNLRVLAIRSFAVGVGIEVLLTINLEVLVKLLAGYMVNLRGYQWWQGALVIAPAAVTLSTTIIASLLIGTHANRRLRMVIGLAVMTLATATLSVVDLYTAKGWQAMVMACWGAGAGLVVVPAFLTAFEGLSTEETLRTAGVFNILRALPAFAVGATLATLLTQHTDAQFDTLRQNIRYNRPVVAESYRSFDRHFAARGSPGTLAERQSHAALERWVHANARAFAFQTIFGYLALVPAAGSLLVLCVPSRRAPSKV